MNATCVKDLVDAAELNQKLAAQLKSRSCELLFQQAQSIYKEGVSQKKLGDKKRAYTLLLRAGIICGIVAKHKDKEKFYDKLDGQDFLNFFKNVLRESDELNAEVIRYFEDETLAKSLQNGINIDNHEYLPEPERMAPTTPGQAIMQSLTVEIKSQEIVFLAKEGKRILIIDYREKKDERIAFTNVPVNMDITVVLCLPNCIEGNITLKNLRSILPVTEREKVSQIQNYDLVVLMDEQDPKRNQDGSLFKPANFLMTGLTDYAYNTPLKHRPVFLKGGFKLWKYAYGCYTNNESRSSLFTEDDDFAKVLNDCRRPVMIDDYPDLNPPISEPPWPTNTPQQSYSAPEVSQQRALPQPNQPQKEFPKPIDFTSFPSHNGPPVSGQSRSTPSAPTFDRSTKPASTVAPPKPSQPTQYAKTAITPLPEVNNLGGPKVAEPVPKPRTVPAAPPAGFVDSYADIGTTNGHPRRYVSYTPAEVQPPTEIQQPQPVAPPRPPIPDRSTKVAPLSSQERLSKLQKFYEICYDHLEKKSAPGCPPVGFRNLGNTCFMNTTLQAIINTPRMRDIFTRDVFSKYVNEHNTLGTKGVISSAFAALMDLYWSGRVRVIVPEIFLKTFADEVSRELVDGRQHDAQEFQIHFLDYLHEDTNRVRKRTPFSQDYDGRDLPSQALDYNRKLACFSSSPVATLFNLRTVSIISCSLCDTSSATFEESSQISLELDSTGFIQLDECLRKHFRKEILQGDSCWNCPRCRKPVVASREMFIWQLPQTLVIHLKRFSQSRDGDFEKNEASVHFEENGLCLLDFLHKAAPKQQGFFNLYAITNHIGKLNHGHYTSFVRNQHRWLKYNDDIVSEVSNQQVHSREAFVLFYSAAGGYSAKN